MWEFVFSLRASVRLRTEALFTRIVGLSFNARDTDTPPGRTAPAVFALFISKTNKSDKILFIESFPALCYSK